MTFFSEFKNRVLLHPQHLLHLPMEIKRFKGYSNKYDDEIATKPFWLKWENAIGFKLKDSFKIEEHDFEAELGLREVR